MRSLVLLICLFNLSMTTFAFSKHAPLPQALVSARSIYIDNQTGAQQATDLVYEALTKWGKFNVVQTRVEADLIATFTKSSSLDKGTTVDSVDMVITARDAKDSLFADHELAKGFHLENNRLGLSARKCVDKLKAQFQ